MCSQLFGYEETADILAQSFPLVKKNFGFAAAYMPDGSWGGSRAPPSALHISHQPISRHRLPGWKFRFLRKSYF